MERSKRQTRRRQDPAHWRAQGGPRSEAERRALQAALLSWYARVARDLPWRRTRDPYAIWISEAMLQQTRVETVGDYWERFLDAFPTIASLANAEEDSVLALWSGLGYYRRARALVSAARVIEERHGGRFPRELEAVRALPGVGPYTAGAVLSIAFDLPVPVVDGNVARVFARLFELDEGLGSSASTRRLWELAEAWVPRVGPELGGVGPELAGADLKLGEAGPGGAHGPGAWNQALMELGATVCKPKPLCGECPVAEFCGARSAGREAELPRKAQKAEPIEVALEILIARRGRRYLVERRPATGRMAGLWQFPTRELVPTGAEARLFPRALPADARGAALLLIERPAGALGELRHSITRHRIHARLTSARLASGAQLPECLRWCSASELGQLPRTGMTKKVLSGLISPGS